jgi:hypothetical protein
LLYDTVQSELEEKIRRLEEDRHSIDITSGQGCRVMWCPQKPQSSPVDAMQMQCPSWREQGGLRKSEMK